ncbi:MAG: c-type cytochrome [Tepidisphaeraceae bacterium]|jgi:mono/diheme cytochrome c family protein
MTQTASARWVYILFASVLLVTVFSSLVIMADDASSPPWVAPARAARKKNPIPSNDNSIAAGKAVYIAQCLKCHGDAAKGDGPSAKDLNPKPKDLSDPNVSGQTDGALYWKITTGRKPMPTFESLTSEEDRWNVVNYLRTLAPAPSTAPATQPANGQ